MAGTPPATLAIVDNDRTVLWALRNALRLIAPNLTILWTAESGSAAIARSRESCRCPDLLLLDMSLMDMRGPSVCREIRKTGARPAILAMTSFALMDYAEDAADAGAQGIISKQGEFGELHRAIDMILDAAIGVYSDAVPRVTFQSAEQSFDRVRNERPKGVGALSPRENEAVKLCVAGWSSERIATRMGISKSSVDTLMQRACRKTGAGNRVELAIQWYKAYGPGL